MVTISWIKNYFFIQKIRNVTEYGALQDGSLSSSNSVNKFWLDPDNQKEDLYFWMAKHQYNRKKDSFSERENFKAIPISKMPGRTPFTRGIMQDSIKLLDAHLIFEPLLTCLGVMPQQMINKYSSAGWYQIERKKLKKCFTLIFPINLYYLKIYLLWRILVLIYP